MDRHNLPVCVQDTYFDYNLIDKKWFWPLVGVCFFLVCYLLRSVFTPFLVAVLIGFLGYPAIDWMERRRISRNISSLILIALICFTLILIVMIFLPVLQVETVSLMKQVPNYLKTVNEKYIPWIERISGQSIQLDIQSIQSFLANNIANVSNMGVYVLRYLSQRGSALFALIFNLFLIPIVLFYVLRDWHPFMREIRCLVPKGIRRSFLGILQEMGDVLSKTIRSQLLVVVIQSFLYSLALWVAGLEFALAIGVMTGVLSVIPYVGFSIGLLSGILSAILQFDSLLQIVPVLIAFGVVQFFESFFLTPRIVGDTIGIHPVMVMFSLLAFGELFGFTGVLIALPACSILVVAFRHLMDAYLHSRFYNGKRNGTIISGSETDSSAGTIVR